MAKSRLWKGIALGAVTLLSAAVLAACGNSGSSSSDQQVVYSYVYSSDPETLDYTVSNLGSTAEITTNLVDGLLESDEYGNLVPSLAEDWTVSKDGLTYTYTLRDGITWYTADGEEYADVVAQDFVTGLKHAADSESDQLYLVQDSIKGLKDYIDGKEKDFSKVGIKAIDEKTIQYTLNQAEPYWNSKTTMGILWPVNEEFLESTGDDFGQVSTDGILVNGAFFLTNLTSKSVVEFEKNENYWDADNVSLDGIKFTYYDGSDPVSLINGVTDGIYTGARVYPNDAGYNNVLKLYGDNIIYSGLDSTTNLAMINLNRSNYSHTEKDESQQEDSRKALQNKNFRLALMYAQNREAMIAQANGEDAAALSIRNLFVPYDFVSADGQEFGDMVATELASMDDRWKDIDLSEGQDAFYNPEDAKAALEEAKTELETQGVSFPIHLDIITSESLAIYSQEVSSFKQSVEENLGKENVVIDIQKLEYEDFLNSSFSAQSVDQLDYDISFDTSWTPDYDDPSSYLDILNSSTGDYKLRYGIDTGEEDFVKDMDFATYNGYLEAAAKETDLTKRYQQYAKAQAWLVDNAIGTAFNAPIGGSPQVTHVVPFSTSRSYSGNKGRIWFKNTKLQDELVTAEEFEAAKETYLKEKEESNATAEEDLENHIVD